MKTSRYTDAQIIAILRLAEGGVQVAELCREHGISSASFYKWRSKYGGMDASLISQMKAMEDENRRLKRMYADPARFRSACDVGAYLGLTPKRYQSGEVDIGGRISKAGDRLTRKLLFEAATVILYRASPTIALKQSGLRLSARSGSWKARVALARKLAVTFLTMWKTNTMFENRSFAA